MKYNYGDKSYYKVSKRVKVKVPGEDLNIYIFFTLFFFKKINTSFRVWGQNNVNNHLPMYIDWRNMYLSMPRLNFDGSRAFTELIISLIIFLRLNIIYLSEGVYISKASYAREGL